ncbi:39S ribosomal protein L54, mitochondrial-like [Acipenser oxyrinchus oxyrinchus]|uniref:Large ribosomal subunit protein mL54 n=1 Tax=Acipenser oxyrinchus oxyrinchus TaxID=40147 RepID=A0AAD8CMW8_ACIOX|nr:39S ribosomal protein L54, mitochondrial-like [Acipenser oxyrinchus oxyrinchus]
MFGIALFGTVRGLRLILSSTHAGAVSSTLPKILACGYAKKVAAKGKGKGMAKDAQKGPEVCKDPVKLTTHAMGVNIYKEGQDPPLQAASEYPEWLFQLDLGPPKQLSELDPESREYWKLMRKEHMWRFNKLHKGKKL